MDEKQLTNSEISEKLNTIMESDGADFEKTHVTDIHEKRPLIKEFLPMIIVVAAAVVVMIIGSFVTKTKPDNVPETGAADTDIYFDTANPYSKESFKQQINTDMAGAYKFLLYGKHAAADPDRNGKEIVFEFDENNGFLGYSSAEDDDFGTYEVNATSEGVVLTINCTDAKDVYNLELSDQNNLVLKSEDKTFALY